MILYSVTILICMIIISILDVLFAIPIFNFGIGYIIFAVVISTIMVIIVDGLIATIIRQFLPNKWFTHDKKIFNVSKREQRFYEFFGIKKWKDHVLELGMFSNFSKKNLGDPTNNAYVSRFLMECNYSVVVHLSDMIFGFVIIIIYPLEYALCFGVPVAIVNFVLNMLPLWICRYNVPKLKTLYKFNERKLKNTKS